MVNFHEHTLWQASYVALMDIHDALDDTDVGNQNETVVGDLIDSAQTLAAVIADSLTRQDRRIARELLTNAVGVVAKTRTHLAVAWGRGIINDEKFQHLDAAYDKLSADLQNFK